jgi:hypothetical protein
MESESASVRNLLSIIFLIATPCIGFEIVWMLSVYLQNAENNNALNVSWLSAVGATIIIVVYHGLL